MERVITGSVSRRSASLNAVGRGQQLAWSCLRQCPPAAHPFPQSRASDAVVGMAAERNEHLNGPPLFYAETSGSTPFRFDMSAMSAIR